MRQVAAILLDSLRNLRSKSLFWVCIGISALAAIALFGTYSFNSEGIRFLWFETTRNPMLRAGAPGPRMFVSFMFSEIYVFFWLSWGAVLLGIISTASILPDFLAGGAVDLALARPISRARLFLAKFLSGLLFAFVQVVVGVVLAYLLIGLKMNWWMHAALIAIPAIMLQFLYLYVVSALVAVVTRSTLASLLVTLLFWFAIFVVQYSAGQLTATTVHYDALAAKAESRAQRLEASIAAMQAAPTPPPPAAVERARQNLEEARRDAQQDRRTADQMKRWRSMTEAVRLVVPKTRDAQKVIANATEAPTGTEFIGLLSSKPPPQMDPDEWEEIRKNDSLAQRAIRDINVPVSLGTSLAFVALTLGAATIIFSRRDF